MNFEHYVGPESKKLCVSLDVSDVQIEVVYQEKLREPPQVP